MLNKFGTGLVVIAAAAIYCSGARGAQSEQFRIYDQQTDTICTYHENEYGYAESDDPAYMGTGICWRKEMMDKADFYIRSKRK